jgi:tripeptide aminopeptidase
VVPDRAVFEGELRSFKASEFEEIRKDFTRICHEEAESSGGKAHLEWIPCYKSYEVGPGENCSLWFIEACKKQNIKPEFVSSRGGGDSNQLNNKGLRNLVFGLGMHNIHSVDEYLIEEEYTRGVRLLAQIIFPESEIV